MLFLSGAQLVMRSSVLTILDLDEVNVSLENTEIFGRCCLEKVDLLVAAGDAAEVLSIPFSCPLPLLRTHPTSSLLLFCFSVGGSNQYSFWTAGGQTNFCLRGRVLDYTKEPLWYNPSFSCIGNLKILHSQPFAATYIHADEAGS